VLSVAAETSEPLPSKCTSASVASPAFRWCLPKRCLANGHIPSQDLHLSRKSVAFEKVHLSATEINIRV
jgi:hypothetical protein